MLAIEFSIPKDSLYVHEFTERPNKASFPAMVWTR
jgi:hypothetical protein